MGKGGVVAASGILTTLLLIGTAWAVPGNPYLYETTSLPVVAETGRLDRRLLPSVGNGQISTTVWTDTIYNDGLYNGYLGGSYRARIQNLHATDFEVDGCSEDAQRTYRLDLKSALAEQTIACPGIATTVLYRTYAHATLTHLLVTEVTITRDLSSGQGEKVTVNKVDMSGEESTDLTWQDTVEIDTDIFYKEGLTKEAETNSSDRVAFFIYYNSLIPDRLELAAGQDEATFVFLSAMSTVEEEAFMDFLAATNFIEGDPSGFSLRSSHVVSWHEKWETGKVELGGPEVDLLLQESISGAFYYLYSSLPDIYNPDNPFFGLSPGGLANGMDGADYYGHVFWDMETWMYPAILMFRPDLAKMMLKYRIQGIGEAQMRAQENGYNGARYPWESAFTGHEVTPDICVPCRENQQHITGDIAYAARQYVSMTMDLEWLQQGGGGGSLTTTGNEFIVEMAKFWESRPTFNETKTKWDINDVMGPDEHVEHAHNSIYTNVVANLAVNTARWTACLAEGANQSLSTIPDTWLDKMADLVFTFNEEGRYHEEYEGFNEQLETGTLDPRGIKQADVVLLNFPLNWEMPQDVQRNDLETYEALTNQDGPAMTWGIFTIDWLDLDDEAKAAELFTKSYAPYVREPFKIWTEVQSGQGSVNFITGAGGFLQALISGYGGLRIYPYKLVFKRPVLPPTAETMKVTGLSYLGSKFDLEYEVGKVTLTCKVGGVTPLVLVGSDGSTTDVVCDAHEDSSTVEVTSFPFNLESRERSSLESKCPGPEDRFNFQYDGGQQPN